MNMKASLFRRKKPESGTTSITVSIPGGYSRRVVWQPQIGDLFPDFTAQTTHGPIRLFDWAEGSWTVLFSYPGARTPVCTTEMASLAACADEFTKHNVKAIGLTASTLDAQRDWQDDIERIFGVKVFFPCAEDPGGKLSRSFGMLHSKASGEMPIRKTFVLDPALRIRAIQEYPMFMGRNTEETLRIIHALQAQDSLGLATPADWFPGDVYLLPMGVSDEECHTRFGQTSCRLTSYLCTVDVEAERREGAPLPGPFQRRR